MSKNVIINGREFETYESYEGETVVKRVIGNCHFLLSELEELGVVWEEVKPKFEDLPPGYYASTKLGWGESVVYAKTPNGIWLATRARADNAYSEDRARYWFDAGALAPLTWAEDAE